VRILSDLHGHIYYILYSDGQCIIKEIRPTKSDLQDHLKIFEMKSDRCLGFAVSGDGSQFYFIDDFKNIIVLERVKEGRQLQEASVLQLKEKDRTHFKAAHDFE
jgi:hypothetical protein